MELKIRQGEDFAKVGRVKALAILGWDDDCFSKEARDLDLFQGDVRIEVFLAKHVEDSLTGQEVAFRLENKQFTIDLLGHLRKHTFSAASGINTIWVELMRAPNCTKSVAAAISGTTQ